MRTGNIGMSRERLEVFFDAVLAIVMTLLVLELRVPEVPDGSSFGQYVAALAPSVPKFVSFVLSFVMLAIHWVGHHFFFRHVERVTVPFLWLNILLLLWLCLLPFPTALLGDHPGDSFPALLYAVDSLLAAATFMAIRAYACRAGLFLEDVEAKRDLGPIHSLPAVALYSVAVAGACVHVAISLACIVLVPMLYFVPTFLHRRRS